jgi:uncharacterized protein (DUF885 family)
MPHLNDASAPDERLHRVFRDDWERTLAESPLFASELGDKRYNRRWPDLGPEARQRRHRADRQVLAQLEAIDPAALGSEDRLNHALFRKKYETAVEEHAFRWWLLPLTAREGIQDANAVADAIVFEDRGDYNDWLERLRRFPEYMNQTIDLMREGVRTGVVHPRVVMQRVPQQVRRQLVADPEQSLFFKPFLSLPPAVSALAGRALAESAKALIASAVVPAYGRFLEFFEAEYLPACPAEVGVWRLPDGAELYHFFARKFTTTALLPAEIHDIGLGEVARIRAEMERVIQELDFRGPFDAFLEDLRTNPRFYCADADRLMAVYQDTCARIDRGVPRLFYRLPRVWYDIRPIPMNIAPDTTTAYYRPLSGDGKRPGTYFVNLYRPEVRPTYEIEALSLHEAVPGHHLQIGLAAELERLPAFRRYAPEGDYTGYVEGWALYAESLGAELGCYADPYSLFGRLTYDMWRAVRLVVDTGIHALRWPRARAIAYFRENTAKTLHDIENEVDRYIAWPGQALAYKIGELTIRGLRSRAEAALGGAFDVRDFHAFLLGDGALPLDILESRFAEWLAGRTGGAAGA